MRFILDAILTRFLRAGRLTIQWPDGRLATYGPGGGTTANVIIADWRTVRGLLSNPALIFGEAYVNGAIEPVGCRLEDLLDLLFQNISAGGRHPGLILRRAIARALRKITQYNPIPRAKKNVASTTTSTAASTPSSSTAIANIPAPTSPAATKPSKKRKPRKSATSPRSSSSTAPISTSWISAVVGAASRITLAHDYGARVTGITLSEEQFEEATARIAAAGLSDRIAIKLQDYRTIAGPFDRIVSVGMFEHVGVTHYGAFFAAIRNLLTEDGIALIHAIGRSDGPSVTNPWITRHIFPGGYAPALSEVFTAVEREKLIATDLEILRLHYAETLRHWRRRFEANRDAIAALYDQRFTRLFELYLAGSEFSFRHLHHMVWQLQLTRHQAAAPITRDYMSDPAHLPEKVRHLKTPSLSRSLGE